MRSLIIAYALLLYLSENVEARREGDQVAIRVPADWFDALARWAAPLRI
jgi:hypothetical protein